MRPDLAYWWDEVFAAAHDQDVLDAHMGSGWYYALDRDTGILYQVSPWPSEPFASLVDIVAENMPSETPTKGRGRRT